MGVAVGIDSHKRMLAVAAVDSVGKVIAAREFANHREGHMRLLRWIRSVDVDRAIGIECSGSFGAALSSFLVASGEDVAEVPAGLAHREARRLVARGKTDAGDAIAIARVVARGDGLARVDRRQTWTDLKFLSDRRDQLIVERTRTINRIHKALVILKPGYETKTGKLTRKQALSRVTTLLRGDRSIAADIVRDLVADVRRLDKAVTEVEPLIAELLQRSGCRLMEQSGIGPVTAARILGELGNANRIRSKAALALLAGVAPIPASSGQTTRHRLNRGGNRKLNHALHVIAINRCRLDPRTRAYVARRMAEGKTKEALRCLKRHICNGIFAAVRNELTIPGAAA